MDEEKIVCSHCGAEIPADSKFCPQCGERVAPKEGLRCPHCGAEVPAGSRFCPQCGGALEEGAEPARPKPKRAARASIREQIRKKGFLTWARDSLGSIRLTIPLLVILTVAAAVGGIIPQAPNTPNAELLYRSYGRFWYNIIKFLLLDDVFHSWWFITLLGLFSTNLIICMVRRLRGSIRLLATPLRPLSRVSAESAAVASFQGKEPGKVWEAARRVLRRKRFRFREEGEQLFGERWRLSRLGPDLIHLGILVILIGGLLGIFRFEGYISLNETELGKVFPPCSSEQQVDCIKNADFAIRVDGFRAELYPDSMMYKDYWTTLTVIEDGREVKTKEIEVNSPLTYKGITFYQTSYGDDLNSAEATIAVEDRESGESLGEFRVKVGEQFQIPGTDEWVELSRFFTSFRMGRGGPVNINTPTPDNPAALLQLYQGTGELAKPDYWDIVFANFPETHLNQDKPYKFYLKDFFVPKLDGISYSRNPGYPVVWWGFTLMMVGLFATFYLAPKRIWVVLDPQGERVLVKGERRLSWGGRHELERIAGEIERELEKGG
jgi:cytochrome c biogenesis protein